MKTHIRKLFIILPLALLFVGGILASTSTVASAQALTNAHHSIHRATVMPSPASKGSLAASMQTTCQWYGPIPPAPWAQVMVFQYVQNPNYVLLLSLESSGPPVVVLQSTHGLSGPFPLLAVVPVPGSVYDIFFNKNVYGIPYASVCSDWRYLGRASTL